MTQKLFKKIIRRLSSTRITIKGAIITGIIGSLIVGGCELISAIIISLPASIRPAPLAYLSPGIKISTGQFAITDVGRVALIPHDCWVFLSPSGEIKGQAIPRDEIFATLTFIIVTSESLIVDDIRIVLNSYASLNNNSLKFDEVLSFPMAGGGGAGDNFLLPERDINPATTSVQLQGDNYFVFQNQDSLLFKTNLVFTAPGKYDFHITATGRTNRIVPFEVVSDPLSYIWIYHDDWQSMPIKVLDAFEEVIASPCTDGPVH